MLKLWDFKKVDIPGSQYGYFSYKTDKYEICLETCLNGYDVALYDTHKLLLKDKECTNISFYSPYAIFKAVEMANKLMEHLEEYVK